VQDRLAAAHARALRDRRRHRAVAARHPPGAAQRRAHGGADAALGQHRGEAVGDPRRARGQAHRHLGHLDRALADCNEAIRLAPNACYGYEGRGQTYDRLGEYGLAVADFARAVEYHPEDARHHNELAWLLATCPRAEFRDGPRAVASATRACELSGWSDAGYLDSLAAAHAESGNFEAAVEWQTKAVELVPRRLRKEFRSRLKLYRAGRPFHAPPRDQTGNVSEE
jgi:tetratricopeptide (TPR) repeat protein